MILGVDTGTATCGWARFDETTRRFAGLGAIELARNKAAQKTDDQADRIATVANELRPRMVGCDRAVVERMSFPPGGTVPIALGFGCVVGIASGMPIDVYTVKPQDWQRAVLPKSGKKVNYAELERVVTEYVRKDRESAIALDSLPPKQRNHAIDACAIALMGAFRLHECRLVKARNAAVAPIAKLLELGAQFLAMPDPEIVRIPPLSSAMDVSDHTLAGIVGRRLRQAKVFQLFLRDFGPKDVVYASAFATGADGRTVESKVSAEEIEDTLVMMLRDLDTATASEAA